MTVLEDLLRDELDMAFRRRTLRLFEWLELADGQRVLDCGCGFGFHLMALSKMARISLVGLDFSLERLRRARRDRAAGDVQRLPFPDATFDRVLAAEVLEHVPGEAQALAEIYRVLKPGGILALSVPHARYPVLWDPINALWTGLGGSPIRRGPLVGIWTNHLRLYEPEGLARAIRAAGFELEKIEEATHHCFPGAHFLLYGVGKPLVEKNLLPGWLRRGSDRSGAVNGRPHPVARILRWFDRRNDRPQVARQRTFVNVLTKARKIS